MGFIVEYWVEFLFTALVGLITYLFRKVKVYYKIIQEVKLSTINLLYIEITSKYRKGKMEGFLTIYEKECVKQLFQEYRNLGGNKLIDFMEEIDRIPIQDSKKERDSFDS